MLRILFVASLLVAVMLGSAEAQKMTFGGLSGTLQTHRVEVPGKTSVQVHVTPETGHFIMTQFCTETVVRLQGSTLGDILMSDDIQTLTVECQTFTPGFVVPQNETLVCMSEVSHTEYCFITGIQTSR